MKQFVLVAATLIASSSAFAGPQEDWANHATYIGAGVTSSRAFVNNSDLMSVAKPLKSFSADQRDTGGKLFVGKQLNKNFAIEGAYEDLGDFNYTATRADGKSINRSVGVRSGSLDLVGTLPLTSRFALLGKVGGNYVMARESYTGSLDAYTNHNPRRKSANFEYGVGAEYKFTPKLAVRGEIERTRFNDALQHRADVNVASVSLVYKLGRPAAAYVAPVVYTALAPAPYVAPAPAPYVAPAPAPAEPVVTTKKIRE